MFSFTNTAHAQGIDEILTNFSTLTAKLIPILFALMLLAFLWGLVKFIFSLASGNEDAAKGARSLIITGILVLFVGASIWGIVEFLQKTFGLEGETEINIPGIISG